MPIDTALSAVSGPLAAAAGSAGADTVAVPVRPGPDGPELVADAREVAPAGVDAFLSAEEATGKSGETLELPELSADTVRRLLLVGVGDMSAAALREAGAAVARRSRGRTRLVATLGTDAADTVESANTALVAFAEGLLLASYQFTLASTPPKNTPPQEVRLVVDDPPARQDALDRAGAVARAVALARDLVNTPASDKSPVWLAEQAADAAEPHGVRVTTRSGDELAAAGFGGILAVGQGSVRPPRLIELDYHPEHASQHIVLVGKGITFDSGGLSLKPNDNMKLMKTDMAGAAAVIGVMTALRELGVPARVTGLVAAAENLPSGSAQRPSDVITHYGGRTVEVLNTDAEGRLVLADALAYAAESFSADAAIDLATLTGAATVALGRTHAALFSSDDQLAAALGTAGQDSGERVWRLPLVDDYREGLDSSVADLANVAPAGYGAGSIVAALFLREFAGTAPWAHLDIAGPARADGDSAEITRGGTGFGVRVLLRYLSPDTR